MGPEEAGITLVGSGGFGNRFGTDGTGIGRFRLRFRFRTRVGMDVTAA
jgi:hypothetical protein